jgi:hypothetical protein
VSPDIPRTRASLLARWRRMNAPSSPTNP